MLGRITVGLAITIVLTAASWSFATDDHDDNPFAKGTWNFSLSGSYATPIRFSRAHVYNVAAAIGKYWWDNHSINMELQGYYADQPDEPDVLIGGIGLLGRFHLLRFDRWSVFFDGGGGVTFADGPFPTHRYEGTHFNFTGKAGLGATYQLHDHQFLTGGVRYFHLSNGQIHGRDQNPTYDGIQIWGGLMWTW